MADEKNQLISARRLSCLRQRMTNEKNQLISALPLLLAPTRGK
jgi:hypothetical protein